MNRILASLSLAWRRSDVRLAAFGLSAVSAVYLGFIGVPVKLAEDWVKRGGYYIIFGTFALFLHSLWRLWQARAPAPEGMTRTQRWLAGGAIGALSLMAIGAEPYHSKILNDEFVLQSTAFNLHYFRDVVTMVRGYEIQGLFLSTDNFLDKRPYFYPFLVSLLHDFTGYRVANAYLLNSLLMPVTLWLVFAFGRELAGWRGGLLAVLLLGSLPLLGQNATGSGMELLNFAMIVASLLLGTRLLREPREDRMAAFLLAVVLLAQSRYESVLYVVAAGLVVALAWLRLRQVCLPWQAVLVPLLLVPVALQNKVLSHSPVLWELGEKTSRFSAEYVQGNLRGAFTFLFNLTAERANSLLLSGAGLLALAWCLVLVVRSVRRVGAASPARLTLACFSVVIVANTVLVLFYYWANFDDPMASRFALPLHLLMAFAVVMLAASLEGRLPAMRCLLLVAGLCGVASAASKFGHHYYSHLGIDEIEWQKRYIAAREPASRLILTNRSTLPWLLQKTPAVLIGRARFMADRLQYQLHEPTFREILVLQSLRPSTVEGDHQLVPEERLPDYFRLELLAEKRFGTRISRVSRLVAVELPASWRSPGKGDPLPVPSAAKDGPAE